MTGIVAVILAGGEATRLGGIDKTLIPLDGIPILSHILGRLRPQVDAIAISANGDPARFASFGLSVLPDRHPGIGPLAGLLRALEWAEASAAHALLTVPGDTPFMPPDLVAALTPAPAVAVSRGRRHHLVALWPVAWRSLLADHLVALGPAAPRRAYGVRAFADTIGIREVPFDAEGRDPFFNVNTPEDRTLAEALAADPGDAEARLQRRP